MPSSNVVKSFHVPAYYHVYNRASGERKLFRDDMDRNYFVKLLCRHLVENYDEDSPVRAYAVEIIAYCLMGTHFHLLLYQEEDADAVTGYMRSVSTAYSMYYNKKYKSKGHVFQSNLRASHILQESYLAHITRYIHLNPRTYTTQTILAKPTQHGCTMSGCKNLMKSAAATLSSRKSGGVQTAGYSTLNYDTP